MSQHRQFHIQHNDTALRKLFVGGLAWETQRDTMRRYFEQFGDILEAVVITDKNTGKSKGYGFVTFKDPEAAMRACQNPSPVIDGRRANCNLAYLGAQKTRPPPSQYGVGRSRPAPGLVASPAFHGLPSSSSPYFRPLAGQYTFPCSSYGYTGYSQDRIYPLNYYGVYGGQQLSPYYTAGPSAQPGMIPSIYPIYGQYAHSSQGQEPSVHYPQMVPFQYPPQQHYGSSGIISLVPSSVPTTSTGTVVSTGATGTGGAAIQASRTDPEQNSST